MSPLFFITNNSNQHMDFKFILSSLVCLLLLFINQGHCVSNVFAVTGYGAVSDGRTDVSQAFLSAWTDACATSGGLMYIPRGTYYVSGASFTGPCNGQTLIQNDGYVLASSAILGNLDYWILFEFVDSLVIYGQGTFDGNGENTWRSRSKIGIFPPTSIKFEQVTNSQVQGQTSINSKAFHICLNGCGNVSLDQVKLSAPEDSPNTDGIHVAKSHDIRITNTHISTGDDCISIGDGTRNINVSGVWCGPGHGISIGSLGKYDDEEDVSGITITNCNLTNTMNGLRIKTWPTSDAPITVSHVTFSDIHLEDVDNPVIIDQYYCPGRTCNHAEDSSIRIVDVKFLDIKGTTSKEVGVTMACSKSRPCEGILLQGLRITTADGQPTTANCSNANGQFVGDDQIPSRCSQPSFFREFDY